MKKVKKRCNAATLIGELVATRNKMRVMKRTEGERQTGSAKIWIADVYSRLAPAQFLKN